MMRHCPVILVLWLLASGSGCGHEPAVVAPAASPAEVKWRTAETLVATMIPQAIAPEGMPELTQIPAPSGCYDCFGYALHLSPADGTYWLHQTGGFAGVWRWYGPLSERDPLVARLRAPVPAKPITSM